VTGPASAPQFATRRSGARQFAVRRNGKPLQLYSLDDIGVAFVLRIFRELLLLRSEETRGVPPVWLVEIAGPRSSGSIM